jgi:arylsulfatase A
MDAAIGRLLDSLSIRGLNENTLIVFASDNGSYRNGSNGPLLGGKSFVYEGGIRVPGIIHWKGQIKEGITINTPVGLIDLMPTICEIVNVDHPKPELLAGENIVPVFNGNNFERKIPLSWFFYRTSPEIAMRIDNYSILGKSRDTIKVTHQFSKPDMDHIRSLQLDEFEVYDLNVDISQEEKIDYRSLDNGEEYKGMIIRQLSDIQREGYYWDTLPPVKGAKKLKSNWRQLRPTGFSN